MPEYFPLLVLNHYADKKKGILLFQYLFEWGEAGVPRFECRVMTLS